jgi:hypothetical protein
MQLSIVILHLYWYFSFYIQHSIDSVLIFLGVILIFSLWSQPSNIFSIKELLLMLEMTCQYEVKHMMLQMKTITSVLKVSTDIITRITAHLIRLTAILVIMCLDLQNWHYFIVFLSGLVHITYYEYYIFSLLEIFYYIIKKVEIDCKFCCWRYRHLIYSLYILVITYYVVSYV